LRTVWYELSFPVDSLQFPRGIVNLKSENFNLQSKI
jgi:hypothetical protein